MVPPEDKQKFLDELENLPIVSVVCKRAGISKATIYRWLDDDPDFKKKHDRALKRGRETLVDHAESKLVKMADKEHFGAIKLILEANSKRYYRPRKPAPYLKEALPVQTVQIKIVDPKAGPEEYQRVQDETRRENQIKRDARSEPLTDPWNEAPS